MDTPRARYVLATELRRWRPKVLIATAGRTPAASPDHHQAHLLIEAARFYSQLTKWDDRFEGTSPYAVPYLVYVPFPFDAEQRLWHSSIVIDISETFEQKMEAVRCFESQFAGQRLAQVRHFVAGYNISVGGRCGFAYGEQFALPNPVAATDLYSLVVRSKSVPPPPALPSQEPLSPG